MNIIKVVYIVAFFTALVNNLPAHADTCPEPQSIQSSCEKLVTENRLREALEEEKFDPIFFNKNNRIKKILQKLNDPNFFFSNYF